MTVCAVVVMVVFINVAAAVVVVIVVVVVVTAFAGAFVVEQFLQLFHCHAVHAFFFPDVKAKIPLQKQPLVEKV